MAQLPCGWSRYLYFFLIQFPQTSCDRSNENFHSKARFSRTMLTSFPDSGSHESSDLAPELQEFAVCQMICPEAADFRLYEPAGNALLVDSMTCTEFPHLQPSDSISAWVIILTKSGAAAGHASSGPRFMRIHHDSMAAADCFK